jgi:hypothetical protein
MMAALWLAKQCGLRATALNLFSPTVFLFFVPSYLCSSPFLILTSSLLHLPSFFLIPILCKYIFISLIFIQFTTFHAIIHSFNVYFLLSYFFFIPFLLPSSFPFFLLLYFYYPRYHPAPILPFIPSYSFLSPIFFFLLPSFLLLPFLSPNFFPFFPLFF